MKQLLITLALLVWSFCFEQILGAVNYQDAIKISQNDDQAHFQNALNNILIPRVVGSEGWKNVQNFIIDELESMGMTVELDSFHDNTPIFGKLNFVNIIGKINTNADRFLVLSAHYDSKYFPGSNFVGYVSDLEKRATDSAVPCALMLNLVKTNLELIKKILDGKNLGLMLIFFDGEEAFLEWTSTDSIYGSRHLAKKWENTPYKNEREIDRINVLVLLDLIGSTNARFVCSFPNTCALNKRLKQIENTLSQASSLNRIRGGPVSMFLNNYRSSGVADDHVPFLQRGISVLHLIPTQFPSTWHTERDNGQNINHDAILNFNRVMRVFIIDYLTTCADTPKLSSCSFRR